jgi:enamine deaminase RidA (YjgF/YER057c/UK114 family)
MKSSVGNLLQSRYRALHRVKIFFGLGITGIIMRKNISSGTPWENIVGYSRAVRVGNHIHVAGTTAVDEKGQVVGKGDPGTQTRRILEIIGKALEEAGASLKDVVRTTIYVTDIAQWEAVGKAHGEVFSRVKPATTMVEVSRLVSDDMMVEIAAEAYVEA